MNDREKVIELLKNYRSYRYAVMNGIEPYEGETCFVGSEYGPRVPRLYRGTTIQTEQDYRAYKRIVQTIDGAVEDVLDDDERDVIRYKYLERNSLNLDKIAERLLIGERTVQRAHKQALKKLTMSLRFVDAPEIINLDEMIRISG
ncbi:sigma factor-like helix-turn-helix DNA-binding protein [Gorillibacterium sp. CAU 1737]|uniref:sigma factor-like helix-turn-helix DNA-binding protein n=1 Tax=Gorillibacterium sp. CAU 1737 TaxID=3140362 RepID=UPI003260EDAA